MNSQRILLLLAGVTACISFMFFVAPTQGANIVLGGNYTDIGTIIFVSPKPGDTATTVGTALLNTLNGITDNSETNPYLLKLCPGIYDLGTGSLQMKEYVDIEGAGENVTTIRSAVNTVSPGPVTAGTVNGANNAEIRFLTVENTGAGNYRCAFYNSSTSPSMLHITVRVSGGTTSLGVGNFSSSSPAMTYVTVSLSGGLHHYAICNDHSSPTMTNVTASASGGANNRGIYNVVSSPTMTNVTASASGGSTGNYGVDNSSSSPTMTYVTVSASDAANNAGVWNYTTGTIRIKHSVIKGTINTIKNGAGATTLVGSTQLDGGAVSNAGTLTCVGVYDENHVELNTNCQ